MTTSTPGGEWYLKLATQPPAPGAAGAQGGLRGKILDSWQFTARAPPVARRSPPGMKSWGSADAAWERPGPSNAYARTYANWASWWQTGPAAAGSGRPTPSKSRPEFSPGGCCSKPPRLRNFLQTNPELLNKTAAESGQNLIRGPEELARRRAGRAVRGGARGRKPSQFAVGQRKWR